VAAPARSKGIAGVAPVRRSKTASRVCPAGITLIGAALLAFSVAGCGSPALVDVDGRPLRRPLLIARLADGWVAVDSSAAGARAVLELRAETPRDDVPPWQVGGLHLQFSSGQPLKPARVRCDAPKCSPPRPQSAEPPTEREVPEVEETAETVAEETCLHVVRAEFRLPQVPTPADSLTLKIGESVTLLAWQR